MRRGHHLREIDKNRLRVVGDHDIKLVEVAVNNPAIAEAHDQIHQVVVQLFDVLNFVHLGPGRIESIWWANIIGK